MSDRILDFMTFMVFPRVSACDGIWQRDGSTVNTAFRCRSRSAHIAGMGSRPVPDDAFMALGMFVFRLLDLSFQKRRTQLPGLRIVDPKVERQNEKRGLLQGPAYGSDRPLRGGEFTGADAAELIDQADALIVAAGAGMGVDSGLPDFRGDKGFWSAYPALAKARMNFMDVASPRTFRTDLSLAWGFYGHRLALYRDTVPHEGFGILLRWDKRMPNGAFVFTSNMDSQFQKAGFAKDRVYECHGSIHAVQCLTPCCTDIWTADALKPQVDPETCRWLGPLPTCSRCGASQRPNILMFDDGEWLEQRADRQQAALGAWLARVRRPVVVELGAGTQIPSVRYFGHEVILNHGGRLVRINPREADVSSDSDVSLPMSALAGLVEIDRMFGTL